MKKTLLALLLSTNLFLTGCFGCTTETTDDPTDTSSPTLVTYEKGGTRLEAPKDWDLFTEDNFPSNVPAGTMFVLRNNIKSDVFTATLSVSQDEIVKGTNSKDFAIKSLNAADYNLVAFKEIAREEIEVTKVGAEEDEIAAKTWLVTFQGRKTITEPVLEFKQLVVAQNGYGYIVTGSYLPSDDQSVVIKIDNMVKSFQLK